MTPQMPTPFTPADEAEWRGQVLGLWAENRLWATLDAERAASEALRAELAKKPNLVNCEGCGFEYNAVHSLADGSYSCPVCAESKLQTEAATLRESNKELVAALSPFRLVMVYVGDRDKDWIEVQGTHPFTVGDVLRARAALTKATEGRDGAAPTPEKGT